MQARRILVSIALLLPVSATVAAGCGRHNAALALSPTPGPRAWSAVACGSDHTLALQQNGTLWVWGSNNAAQLGLGDNRDVYAPVRMGRVCTWTFVACGYQRTAALRKDGTLWAWGLNYRRSLGVGRAHDILMPAQVGSASDGRPWPADTATPWL